MNLTNYHSHCSFCDGKAPAEEFVKSAVAAGFTSYGVSSHAPLPFTTRWTLKSEAVGDYLDEIKRLKEKYKDVIDLYVGMEIDYLSAAHNPSIAYFQTLPLDYRIGSVHYVTNEMGEIMDMDTCIDDFKASLSQLFGGDLKQLVSNYFNASMRMVEAGGFDFVGHLDKISYNASLCLPGVVDQGWYKKLLLEYLSLVSEKGIMVEVNTKAYAKKGYLFPNVQQLGLLKRFNIPVLVNSDAHLPELVNDSRMPILEFVKNAGYTTVRQLEKGVWQDVRIG